MKSTTQMPALRELGADLLCVHPVERLFTIVLPFAWCAAYFVFAFHGLWFPAVASLIALSFVTYGSTSHDLVHRSLGLSRRLNSVLLCVIELLALRSGHAYQAVHLRHHAVFPDESDIESTACRRSLIGALAEGFFFNWRIWRWAYRNSNTSRTWISGEGVACAAIIIAAIAMLPFTPIFAVYVGLVIAGSWLIPFATSFVPHTPYGEGELFQTRAFRGWIAHALSFGHLYHLEHHLYPAVPHRRWSKLANRLDPYFEKAGVSPTRLWF